MAHLSPVRRLPGDRVRSRPTRTQASDLISLPRHHRGRYHIAVVLALVVVVGVAFPALRPASMTVLTDGRAVVVETTLGDDREALAAAGVDLARGDRLRSAAAGRSRGAVSVERALPVHISADGRTLELRTRATTVGGALAEAGITLGPGDRVYARGQRVAAGGPLASRESLVRSGAANPALALDEPLTIEVERARPVTVWIDTQRVDTRSAAADVQELLRELGMSVREVDLVDPGLHVPVESGMVVRLARAKTVAVIVDGVEETLYTQADSVGEVLQLLDLDPGEGDILQPRRAAFVYSGMTITVGLTRTVTESVEEEIAPGVQYRRDATLAAGTVRILAGEPGTLRRDFEVTYRNGEEIERVEVGTTVVEEPVPEVHLVGSSETETSSPVVETSEYTGPYKEKMRVWATWYDARHGGKDRSDPNYGITATGVPLEHGICATDPNVIPLGTRFFVPGYGMCLAADVGGAIKGAHIDLGFPEGHAPNPWATRYVDIYILD